MIRHRNPNRAERRAARRRARARRSALAVRRTGVPLAALVSSALSLPGLAPTAAADSPEGRWVFEHSSHLYKEADLDEDDVTAGGETSRYEILSHQFRLVAPLADRMDLAVDVMHERMSGATPWYVEEGADGDPVQVMSGATVKDSRTDVLLSNNLFFDNANASLMGGFSKENDYLAINGGFKAETHFNEKNTTIGSGAGFSVDRIEPTDAEEFGRVSEEDRQSVSLSGSISQILTKSSILQTGLTYQHQRGFLSDPYKLVSVDGGTRPDTRPDERNQLTWLTRYRHHFEKVNGTLHADYQFYWDDWEIFAHTLELAWYQTLFRRIRLVPSVRYYTQTQAEFYAPFFDQLAPGANASSDYRLSPYGALAARIKAETEIRDWPFNMDWKLGISWERYMSADFFSIGKVKVENPGLVDYDNFSVSLTARF